MSATPDPEPDPDPDPAEMVDGLANYILSVSDEFGDLAGGGDSDGGGNDVDTKEWQYEEGPRGGDRWRNSETGEVVYDKPAEAEPAPDSGEGESSFTADPGRYGLASNPEVLENTFEAADSVTGSREAGIEGGNTTGDKMKIAEMDDGSRVFATPLSAYPGRTGVVRSEAEARRNNLRSPDVIDALGGTAAQTALTDGPGDEAYIAKEGIPGDTVAEYSDDTFLGDIPDAVKESAADTMAAAYFVGNVDLHGGNMVVSEDQEVAVIDHDSAGKVIDRVAGVEQVPDLSRYDNGPPGIPTDAREKIYDKARDIRAGRVDFGAASRTRHEGFAEDAADKAVRAAYVDPSYDLPDDQVPASLQFPPTLDIETIDDFEDPDDDPDEAYPVVYVDNNGNKVTGELINVTEDELVIDGRSIDLVDDPNRVVEIL